MPSRDQKIFGTRFVTFACTLVAVLVGGAATAHAADNKVIVDMQPTHFFTPNNKNISVRTIQYVYNPVDPVDVTVTEAADGLSVTITVLTNMAGGFTASAPCSKTSADTAVCPTSYAPSFVVTHVSVGATAGADTVTVDTPSLKASVSLGDGADYGEISRSITGSISGGPGNDTLVGGTGQDHITADQGVDTIYLYSNPAGADNFWCGNPAVEGPVDSVIVDSLDTDLNNNCASVTQGP